MNFFKKQWEQIAGNVKYAVLVFLGGVLVTGFGIVTHGLRWWQQAIVIGLFSLVTVWAVAATFLFWFRHSQMPKTSLETSSVKASVSRMSDSDPRIYLADISSEGDSFATDTVFVLENRGGSVAHRAHIQSIQFSYRKVNFIPADNVAVNGTARILPWIENAQTDQHNIFKVLDDVWNEKGKATGRFDDNVCFPVTITHESFNGVKFAVTVDIVYEVSKRRFWENNQGRIPQSKKPHVFQIRHSAFRRIS